MQHEDIENSLRAINKSIGNGLKFARKRAGETQASTSAYMSVSQQQYGKYEKGTNRLKASALSKLSEALETTPVAIYGAHIPSQVTFSLSEFFQRETNLTPEDIQLIILFYSIPDMRLKRKILDLAETISNL